MVHTAPNGGVRFFGVPKSGKDIFNLHILVQNLKSNSIKILDLAAHLQIDENQWQLDLAFLF